jgi:hypothetical protein
MRRTNLRVLTVLKAAVLCACGGSTDVVVDLSEAEAAALAEAVVQAAFVTSANAFSDAPAPVGPAAAPFGFDADVSFTEACPLGGSVDVDGSVGLSGDDETNEGRIELAVRHDHAACVVEADDGTVFTFDGAPSVTLDLVLETDGVGQLDWSGVIEGRLAWSTEEREGTCPIALEFGGTVSEVEQSIAVSVDGTVCRAAVEHSWSLTLSTDPT